MKFPGRKKNTPANKTRQDKTGYRLLRHNRNTCSGTRLRKCEGKTCIADMGIIINILISRSAQQLSAGFDAFTANAITRPSRLTVQLAFLRSSFSEKLRFGSIRL